MGSMVEVFGKPLCEAGNLVAVVSFPLVVVIYCANLLSIFWLDYIYGVALGLGLPELVLKSIA
jgi:hypothetical protein